MNLLLTLLVPTWNRRKNLEELLPLLLPELDRQPDLELIVSNNASPDDTAAYLNTLPSHPRLRVINQPVNYGATIHLAWLYGQARGRWLWLICDDDLLAQDAVTFVCSTLRAHPELGWIHLPHVYLLAEGGELASRLPPQDEFLSRGRSAFVPYVSWITFATSNVVRTDLLQRQLPHMRWDNEFWPTDLLLAAAAETPAMIPARRFITAGAEITWAERRIRVLHCDLTETILSSRCLSRSERAACLLQKYRDSPNQLGRLVVIKPTLLVRAVWCQPRLLGILLRPSELAKLFRPSVWAKLARRLFRGRKVVGGMFPNG